MNTAIEQYWQCYLDTLPELPPLAYTAWGFGDSPRMAEELGKLVQAGIKTATASLLWEYEFDGEVPPQVGDFSIILDGAENPLCIIETTRLYTLPFYEVDAEQAYEEGEGDRSLAYWRRVHWDFFSRSCQRIGRDPVETMPILCERFRLVYRK